MKISQKGKTRGKKIHYKSCRPVADGDALTFSATLSKKYCASNNVQDLLYFMVKKKSIFWRKTTAVCYKQYVLYVIREWILTCQFLLFGEQLIQYLPQTVNKPITYN